MRKEVAITVGADPEFFLSTGRMLVPSTNIIGGSKKEPIPIPGLPAGFTMQEDNIMGEFNIPACSTSQEFSNAINTALDGIRGVLPKQLQLVIKPSGVFKPKYTNSAAAKVFGCDPDINAWTEEENIFIPAENKNLRCCGGHIHIGLPGERMGYNDRIATIRCMDVFLGLPSIVVDKDTERRKMYGKAGAFRAKKYGVEYRTLSNFWIETPYLREWAFNATKNAVSAATDSSFMEDVLSKKVDIIEAINDQNSKKAEELANHFAVLIP